MAKKMKVKHMGKTVTVNKILHREYDKIKEQWIWVSRINPAPWVGWLVGFRTVFNGNVDRDYEMGTTFITTSGTFCAIVASWPNRKPIHVPLDGYELGGEPVNPNLWSKQEKEDFKSYNVNRDSSGRFL